MKTIITTLLAISCTTLMLFGNGLSPQQPATLYKHMKEVNVQWEKLDNPPAWLEIEVAFVNDNKRIQTHLLLVEQFLRERTPQRLTSEQQANRYHHLDVLNGYWQASVFPENSYHEYRIPYFVDVHSTACAVGYLMLEDGQQATADAVVNWNNYAYIHAIDKQFDALGQWAAKAGFTIDELAWIQPAYSPPLVEVDSNFSGTINVLTIHQAQDVLVIAGDFDAFSGDPLFNNIMTFNGNDFINLDGGTNGTVNTVAPDQNTVYAGGTFTTAGNVAAENIAQWDGDNWSPVGEGLNGTVHDLLIHDSELYALGDFTKSGTTSLNGIAKFNGTNWVALDNSLNGDVTAMTSYNGKLTIVGNFTQGSGNTLNKVAQWDGASWQPLANGLLNVNQINDVTVAEGHLYVAGREDPFAGPMGVLYKLSADNLSWENLTSVVNQGEAFAALHNFVEGSFYSHDLGGIFDTTTGVMFNGELADTNIYGLEHTVKGLLGQQDSSGYFTVQSTDSKVKALAAYKGHNFMGGHFNEMLDGGTIPGFTLDITALAIQPALQSYNLVHSDSTFTSVGSAGLARQRFYPNPVPAGTTVRLQLPADKEVTVQLTDLSGRTLFTEQVGNQGVHQLSTQGLQQGLYLIQVRDEQHGLISTGKLVVQ